MELYTIIQMSVFVPSTWGGYSWRSLVWEPVGCLGLSHNAAYVYICVYLCSACAVGSGYPKGCRPFLEYILLLLMYVCVCMYMYVYVCTVCMSVSGYIYNFFILFCCFILTLYFQMLHFEQ